MGHTKSGAGAFEDSSWFGVVLFLILALVSGVFQFLSGAWSSDFGGHADEGAHVVTSLMVRDYLAGGWIQQWNPMRYAEAYYDLFPKVAIGHYPPAFYVLASSFLLFSRSPESLFVLMASLNALLGWGTWRLGKSVLGSSFAAVLAAGTVCLLPLVRMYTVTVMADLLLGAFCVLAINSFTKFLEKGLVRDSLFFGFFSALAILTKGSGVALSLLPLFAIPLSGKWKLFKSFRLWLAPIPVIILAVPWMLMTWKISAEGIYHGDWFGYVKMAVPFYFLGIVEEFGWISALLLCVSVAVAIFDLVKKRKISEAMASIIALIVSVSATVIAIPTGVDHRYLLPLVPAIVLICIWNCVRLRKRVPKQVYAIFLVFVSLGILLPPWRTVEKKYTGARQAVHSVLDGIDAADSDSKRHHVLIVSDASGEGALTAAAAFQGPERLKILRGTKVLATSDWMGRGYSLSFESEEEFLQILAEERVRFTIVESFSARTGSEHWKRAATFLSESVGVSVDAPQVFPSLRKRGEETVFLVYPFADE